MNARTLVTVTAFGLSGCASHAPPQQPSAESILGTWVVDLRPRPEAPTYLKTFVVTAVSGHTFQGSFYDTQITEGRLNLGWGTVRMAFVTNDGSGYYHHAAVLAGNKLEGLTNATGRGFLAYWSATRQ